MASRRRQVGELRASRVVSKHQLQEVRQWLDNHGAEADVFELEVKLEHLDNCKIRFETIQTKIESLDVGEVLHDDRRDFESSFCHTKARFKALISALRREHDRKDHVQYGRVDDLPELKLPKFSGDYMQWPTFWETFNTLVHDNPSPAMTNLRKFSRLKDSCTGVALNTIGHLQLSDENYGVARELLERRFDHKRLIFESSVSTLLDLEPVNDTASLRRLSDAVQAQLKALEKMTDAQHIQDGLLIALLLKKVDVKTRDKWEERMASTRDIPVWNDFIEFVENRCSMLESVDFINKTNSFNRKSKEPFKEKTKTVYVATQAVCKFCDDSSCIAKAVGECSQFILLSPNERRQKVNDLRLCRSCLKKQHAPKFCKGLRCQTCGARHHTLLHLNLDTTTGEGEDTHKSGDTKKKTVLTVCVTPKNNACVKNNVEGKNHKNSDEIPELLKFNQVHTLLATAMVFLRSKNGMYLPFRALIDGASQINFVTKKIVDTLQLPIYPVNVPVVGIHGDSETLTQGSIVHLRSIKDTFECQLGAVVLQNCLEMQPSQYIDIKQWTIPSNIQLADSKFNVPHAIDLIIGANWAYRILSVGQIELGPGKPLAQKTSLGWIIVGDINLLSHSTKINSSFLAHTDQESATFNLEKFWETEEITMSKPFSRNEQIAEDHFKQFTRRADDGRFIVRLPFGSKSDLLGESYLSARAKWLSIERQLKSKPDLQGMYTQFMMEYESLGHMEEIKLPSKVPHYFLPHFHVLKLDSTSTKLRVVFNGSAPTSSGKSLNDILLVGPTIQQELVKILLRFRAYWIAMCADIAKMYRQIMVADEDRNFQCIVYRRPNESKISVFRLTTVTYGTSSAPFLAIRCVAELARSEKDYPLASRIVLQDMYVDNMLSGANSREEALEIFHQVNALMEKGQMPMRKWYTNDEKILDQIPPDYRETTMSINDSEIVKTLGMIWVPFKDVFMFKYEPPAHLKPTKRNVLSEIAKIFDPLGILAPVVVKAKMFMQYLFTTKLDWDESLSQADFTEWMKFRNELKAIDGIEIPRHVLEQDINPDTIQFHGFADASTKAYAAVIYVRYLDNENNFQVQFLIAKTRVAPLKIVSLPRLELCAALLLSELFHLVEQAWPFELKNVHCWSDSTIALTWITGSPNRWTQFVANRATKVQNLTKKFTWHHVSSADNAADVASRGIMPSKLREHLMWYKGPEFLKDPEQVWLNTSYPKMLSNVPEEKLIKFTFVGVVGPDLIESFKYHNDLDKIQKVFGYVAKFICNIKSKSRTHGNSSSSCTVDAIHMKIGLQLAVKIVQVSKFPELYMALKTNQSPDSKHSYDKLQPFMKENIIRVGGRLKEADLQLDAKFPMLLPREHPLTKAVFLFAHSRLFHAGPQATLAHVREQFWPLNGKIMANKISRQCITCRKANPQPFQQLMGNLPKARVEPYEKCFHVTGIDFCGPFYVKQRGRGQMRLKVYISVFVCFATKAIHLEVVEDLTTDGFLNCLKRFCARRGVPSEIWSDNGTTFVGTKAKLDIMANNVTRDNDMGAVYEWCRTQQRIQWKFIAPCTPHQGGLWEAGVRLAKLHLKKVIGNSILFYKDFETMVVMVEGVLNSRPLTPLAMHPGDETPLTPGHFLCGTPIQNLPEMDLTQQPTDHLKRWKLTTSLKQHFWKRWSTEYLHSLQQRQKWSRISPNVKVGTLVVMINKDTPAFTWEVGNIVEIHPGKDGLVRVVDVKTKRGIFRRGITQLCPILEE